MRQLSNKCQELRTKVLLFSAFTDYEDTKSQRQLSNSKLWFNTTGQKLGDHNRILMLLSANDIVGVRHLLSVALQQGASAQTICGVLECAISDLYHPRGRFTQREFDISFMVKSLGSPCLLYALQQSHGLASWRTVRRHVKIPKLITSISVPTSDEISQNISSFYDPSIKPHAKPTQGGLLEGNVAMFDGIALETICRYCPEQDSILGLCQEHSHRVNTKVDSVESVEEVHTALAEPKDSDLKVCFGSEATVVAIAPYTQDDYYTPVPIVASPSDKMEKVPELAKWMQTVLDGWRDHEFGEKVNGPIWALASDGDSTCAAKHIICMVKKVDQNSPLGKILSSLFGLNCWTSAEGATSTCDPKHIFKHFATLLQSIVGLMLDDHHVNSQDIIEHLCELPNMTQEKAYQLLDPVDKQNVPKAVTLLQSLLQLKDLPPPLLPGPHAKRHAIIFVADMLGYFT